MEKIPYEALCKRYGICCVGLSDRQKKERLAEKLIPIYRAPYTATMTPRLQQMSDAELDEILGYLASQDVEALIYESSRDRANPSKEKRRPEIHMMRFNDIKGTMNANAREKWSAETAAKAKYPKWKKHHKNFEILANAFFRDQRLVRELEEAREKNRGVLLLELVQRHSDDEAAMSLWREFWQYGPILSLGYEYFDLPLILRAGPHVDRVFSSTHPFALGLKLLYAPMDRIWLRYGPLFEKIRDPEQWADLSKAAGVSGLTADEATKALTTLLRQSGALK